MGATNPLRVALLVCDTPVQPVVDEFGGYPEIYQRWLDASKPDETAFHMKPFDIVNDIDNYPDPDNYEGIILTGSAASAYSPLPWIERLKKYIKDVSESHPRVKLIGICFGHQIIASALGGECVPNSGTWEIGTTEVSLTPTGKGIFGTEAVSIQQMHRDHVPTVPPGFILLGSTTVSAIQGLALPYPQSTDGTLLSPAETHILTVQGHPEYTGPIVEKIVNVREQKGIIDSARAAKAREDGYRRHDGTGTIAQAMWKVMLNMDRWL